MVCARAIVCVCDVVCACDVVCGCDAVCACAELTLCSSCTVRASAKCGIGRYRAVLCGTDVAFPRSQLRGAGAGGGKQSAVGVR
eukprot:2991380-Rhodomonas_salina.1